MKKNRPKVVRKDNIQASIFSNISKKGRPYKTIQISKVYQRKDGTRVYNSINMDKRELDRLEGVIHKVRELKLLKPKTDIR